MFCCFIIISDLFRGTSQRSFSTTENQFLRSLIYLEEHRRFLNVAYFLTHTLNWSCSEPRVRDFTSFTLTSTVIFTIFPLLLTCILFLTILQEVISNIQALSCKWWRPDLQWWDISLWLYLLVSNCFLIKFFTNFFFFLLFTFKTPLRYPFDFMYELVAY